jgi:chromosome segregation ATPase
MANIYELTNELQVLWNLMEDGNLDDEMIIGAFDCAKEDLADKLEGYCKFIKNLESDIAGLKAEEERLNARRKAMENTITRCKDAMKFALNTAGEKKIPCGSFVVSVQNSTPSVVLDEQYIENIPEKYLIPQEPKIDKKRIKADIDAGKNLDGIAHLETTTSLRIR